MMASTDPERRNRSPGGGRGGRPRPPIWSGGRQRPPFDRAAFWRVTKANSRDLLWPVMARIGERFERSAHAVACGFGAAAVTRLGKGGRILPPRTAVVAALRATGLWLLVGADRIDRIGRRPGDAVAEPDPFNLAEAVAGRPGPRLGPEPAATTRVVALRPVPRPRPPAPEPEPVVPAEPRDGPGALREALTGAEEPVGEDPLLAIRSMMRAAAAPAPMPQRPQLPPPPEPDPITGMATLPPLAPPEPPGPGPNLRWFGVASGLAFFALSLPVGALMAGASWLLGEDLRLRDTA